MVVMKMHVGQLRQRGIEPRSTAWKATMLTITPLTLVPIAISVSEKPGVVANVYTLICASTGVHGMLVYSCVQ